MGKKGVLGVIAGIVAVIIAVMLVICITIIPEGKIGVSYRFGKVTEVGIPAGLHFHSLVEKIRKVDITEQITTFDLSAYTKDTQTVDSINVQVNYRYDSSKIDTIVRTVGIRQVDDKLVNPNLTSILKNEVGKYKAEELIASRSELEANIQNGLTEFLGAYGIIVSRVSIQDIEFKPDFERIVEEKVAAEQQALKIANETLAKEELAKQKVIDAQAEADAIRIKAEAEAAANKLLNSSLTPTLVQYYKVQQWNGVFPNVMGNNINPFVTIGE